jgi:hypothetical protein
MSRARRLGNRPNHDLHGSHAMTSSSRRVQAFGSGADYRVSPIPADEMDVDVWIVAVRRVVKPLDGLASDRTQSIPLF